MVRSKHSLRLGGGGLGALIGAALGLLAVLIIDRLLAGDQNGLFWLPAGIVTGIFVGGMIGLLLAEIYLGTREDEADTAAARAELAQQERERTASGDTTSPRG
ncbi:MAG TPA: hypothetical protein VFD90_03830 [Gaiellales bacterium]|jgi:hypothetical protein|nr:hypothetical protein [Gaiellales bacterium]